MRYAIDLKRQLPSPTICLTWDPWLFKEQTNAGSIYSLGGSDGRLLVMAAILDAVMRKKKVFLFWSFFFF